MTPQNPNAPPLEALRLNRLGVRGVIFLVLLPICLLGVGIYAYIQQRLHGDVVTSMRSVGSGGAAWGLYIMFDIFFVGLAASSIGIVTAAHLFRLRDLRPMSRVAEVIALLSLLLAGMCVMADQGRPLDALLNLPQFARVMSPFFGSFTLIVGVGVAASAVMLYLGGRGDAAWCARSKRPFGWAYKIWASGYKGTNPELSRHRRARFWLSLVIFPYMILAYSTLGFVFGTQGGRPGWYGALRAPSMLVVAGISGIGLIIAIAGWLQRNLKAKEVIPPRLFVRLGNVLLILISVFFYILVVETLTDFYAGHEAPMRVARAILTGVYAPAFWTMLALFLAATAIFGTQFLRREPMVGWSAIGGLLLNAGAILRRYLVVVPAQTHGHYMDSPPGFYAPNWIEIAVILGILSFGVLALTVFMRAFPVIPMHSYYGRLNQNPESESRARTLLRLGLTSTTLVAGVAIALFGLAMSARMGTEPYLDPVFPFSPVVFIIGIVMTLYAAAVYVVAPPG